MATLKALRTLSVVSLLLPVVACGSAPEEDVSQSGASLLSCVSRSGRRVCFQNIHGIAVTEGDIALGKIDDVRDGRMPQSSTESSSLRVQAFPGLTGQTIQLWPNATIPYAIADGFAQGGIDQIRSAINEWNRLTPIRMVPAIGDETQRITFVADQDSCHSNLGVLTTPQEIHVVPKGNCAVVHEIGHAVGLWHEQSRPDRDEYISIHSENIVPDFRSQFEVQAGDSAMPYDINSVMHYPSTAFSANNRPTITLKDGSTGALQYKWHLSQGDIDSVVRLYGGSPPLPVAPAPGCGTLESAHPLARGSSISSCNGRFALHMQTDGNVVLYRQDGVARFQTKTSSAYGGSIGETLIMQGDGNLVVYSASGLALWHTKTFGHPGAKLAVQDDGNLVVRDGANSIWSSHTAD